MIGEIIAAFLWNGAFRSATLMAERNSSFRTARESETAMNAKGIRPYRVDVSDEALRDLDERLSRTLWPDELPGVGGAYGQTTERVRALATYWRDEFDWRALEARINAYPQFVA